MNLQLRLTNYITRYAPSRERVIAYLSRKKSANPEELLDSIGYDETMMIDIWLRSLIAIGKSERDIRTKLIKKGFPRDLINEKTDSFHDEILDWDEYKRHIENQVSTLIARGKSRQMTSALLLSKYPYFRDQISDLIRQQDDTAGLCAELQKYMRKYDTGDHNSKQKIISALMRKGFSYDAVKQAWKTI